ncbi:glycosyltransferase [Peziza echinospora]|nr:glycosyltransferase [Peziza echinospora]
MEPLKLVKSALAAALNPAYSKYLAPLLLLGDVFLSLIVLFKVPYTEIDWKAYMEQIAQYSAGEMDYIKIKGGTGPLVYPAGHVYIYSLLYKLTDQGRDVFTAQVVFVGLYLATLALVMAIYIKAKVPPYILPLLVLSKRLHSIYILRLFNDCFSVLFLLLSLLTYQHRLWTLGSALFSLSVSVKMGSLLALPGIGVTLLQAIGRDRALTQASIMAQIQLLLATPFIMVNARSYLSRAFELSRTFLWKETVNWRFLGQEERFQSRWFSAGLLVVHAGLLVLFICTRWTKPSNLPLTNFLRTYLFAWTVPSADSLQQYQISQRVTSRFMLTTILTSNAIGMLCARSLHFQFYSWLAWGTPYLLWVAGWNPVAVYAIWAAQEWAWNVYPTAEGSSAVVVAVLAVVVAGVWVGGYRERERERESKTVRAGEERSGREKKEI